MPFDIETTFLSGEWLKVLFFKNLKKREHFTHIFNFQFCHWCDIRDFQNGATFFIWWDSTKKLAHFRKLLISAIPMSNLKKTFDNNWLHSGQKTDFFLEISVNYIKMTPWRHTPKFLSLIERGDQYNSFDMLISSLRQLVTALGQIFSFFLYTGHMTSSKRSGEPWDVIFDYKIFMT